LAIEAGQVTAIDCTEQQIPTFPRVSRNVGHAAMLLDTLPTPSTVWVVEVYHRLKNILDTATASQEESSFQHQVEVSVLTPDHSKIGAKVSPKGHWSPERLPRQRGFLPTTSLADQMLGQNLKYADGTT
jgi:hypothetical protein